MLSLAFGAQRARARARHPRRLPRRRRGQPRRRRGPGLRQPAACRAWCLPQPSRCSSRAASASSGSPAAARRGSAANITLGLLASPSRSHPPAHQFLRRPRPAPARSPQPRPPRPRLLHRPPRRTRRPRTRLGRRRLSSQDGPVRCHGRVAPAWVRNIGSTVNWPDQRAERHRVPDAVPDQDDPADVESHRVDNHRHRSAQPLSPPFPSGSTSCSTDPLPPWSP